MPLGIIISNAAFVKNYSPESYFFFKKKSFKKNHLFRFQYQKAWLFFMGYFIFL